MNKEKDKKLSDMSALAKFERFIDKNKLWLSIALAAVLIILPLFGFSQYIMRIFVMIGLYSILGMGLNMLTGYTGQVSLGHAGFYAIGAYTSALLTVNFGVPFWISALCGAAMAGVCGVLLGLPSLRLAGTYLSIVTLGFGEIVKMIVLNWSSVTGGTLGVKNIPRPKLFGFELNLANNGLYYLIIVLAALVALICWLIMNSNVGRTFKAIKEDELAATMMGIRTTKYKVMAFSISAAIVGFAGAFYAPLLRYIDANSFTFDVSILIISVVIVGGMGTIRGMFFGAALLVIFPEISRFLMEYRFVFYGVLLVVVMRFRPQGILGWQSTLPYRLSKATKAKLAQRNVEIPDAPAAEGGEA